MLGLGSLMLVDMSCQSSSSLPQADLDRGREVYLAHCVSCHGSEGDGNQGFYPALTQRPIQEAYTLRAIRLISQGSEFEGGMKPISLSNQEISDVINYIQNSWGNEAALVDSTYLHHQIQTFNTL